MSGHRLGTDREKALDAGGLELAAAHGLIDLVEDGFVYYSATAATTSTATIPSAVEFPRGYKFIIMNDGSDTLTVTDSGTGGPWVLVANTAYYFIAVQIGGVNVWKSIVMIDAPT